MRFCVIVIAAAIACRGKPPPPAQPAEATPVAAAPDAQVAGDATLLDQDLPQLALRSLAMYQDIATAFAASGQDCAVATTKLRQFAGTYRDVTIANAKVLHDGRAKQLQAALDPHSDAFDAAARSIMQSPTMSKCSQDPSFAKAFDALLSPPP
jgi:hypothetical protein